MYSSEPSVSRQRPLVFKGRLYRACGSRVNSMALDGVVTLGAPRRPQRMSCRSRVGQGGSRWSRIELLGFSLLCVWSPTLSYCSTS